MTNAEKRLEEFEKNIELIENLIKVVSDTDVLDTEDVENYYRNTDRIINGYVIDNAWKALGLKGKLKELFTESIQQALAEEREKIEEMRDLPPPFPADKENPMKHIYQNQGYTRALDDILTLPQNKETCNHQIESNNTPAHCRICKEEVII